MRWVFVGGVSVGASHRGGRERRDVHLHLRSARPEGPMCSPPNHRCGRNEGAASAGENQSRLIGHGLWGAPLELRLCDDRCLGQMASTSDTTPNLTITAESGAKLLSPSAMALRWAPASKSASAGTFTLHPRSAREDLAFTGPRPRTRLATPPGLGCALVSVDHQRPCGPFERMRATIRVLGDQISGRQHADADLHGRGGSTVEVFVAASPQPRGRRRQTSAPSPFGSGQSGRCSTAPTRSRQRRRKCGGQTSKARALGQPITATNRHERAGRRLRFGLWADDRRPLATGSPPIPTRP